MKAHSQKFLQQRKFYMALPILVLPFITMIFWALGGGKGNVAQAHSLRTGLNMELPGAHFAKGEELWNKFSLYEQAKRDSIRYEEARRNDPYYVVNALAVNTQDTTKQKTGNLNTSVGSKDRMAEMDRDEALVSKKLELLQQSLNATANHSSLESIPQTRATPSVTTDPLSNSDVDRLEKMMELVSEGSTTNPEMQQIGDVLEKILDVQHPERVSDKIRQASLEHSQQVFAVTSADEDNAIEMIEGAHQQAYAVAANDSLYDHGSNQTNGFYGLDSEESMSADAPANAIQAVVHQTQTLVTGATLRLRLLDDVYINGREIKQGQFVYGKCSINGDRLTVAVNSIRDDNAILPVALSVFDLDGMEGISIPGAISRDAAKQGASQSIQDIELYSMDNSLGVQAATAGVAAAKGLFNKKIKQVKVTVKAGYQILLRDNNQAQR